MDMPVSFPEPTGQDRLLAPPSFWRRHRVTLGAVAAVTVLGTWIVPQLLRVSGIGASVALSRLVIAEVRRGEFVRDFAADGRVVAADSPMLYAPAAGTLRLQVKPGDAVTKGQVLAVIASPDLESRWQVERAGLDVPDSDLRRARLEAERQATEMRQAQERATVDLRSAERDLAALPGQSRFDIEGRAAGLRRQQLLVADLARQVEELRLRSPVDGRVGQIQVADRAAVPRDAPLLSVVDLSRLEVEIEVPESFARELAPGVAAELSGNGGRWTGSISGVSPEVVNGQVVARVRFTGAPPQGLRQNQRLSVRVLIDQRADVLTVERGSLTDQGGYAYKVAEGIATRTPVRFGSASIGRVEVLEGLAAGDRVVVSGMDAFDNADRVMLSK